METGTDWPLITTVGYGDIYPITASVAESSAVSR